MMERNCPKNVEFYSKNKFEKLVHLVGFIIRIYHDEQSYECQNSNYYYYYYYYYLFNPISHTVTLDTSST